MNLILLIVSGPFESMCVAVCILSTFLGYIFASFSVCACYSSYNAAANGCRSSFECSGINYTRIGNLDVFVNGISTA